ncbi:MAG: Peptidase, partial [Jatrophihabitantaceae bacterium]|nr:Peptidase [Jatrophihabitantaceae bacterium]
TGVLAGIDGDIARLGIAAQASLDRYDQTTRDLMAALDAVTQAQSALDAAHAAEATAREDFRQLARQAYMSAPTLTAGDLLVADNPNQLVEVLDTRRFIAERQSDITAAVSAAVMESSNAVAGRRAAQQAAERLQAQAAVDKVAALATLRDNEAKRAALAAQREQLNAAAAAAAAALSGLQDQRAAYDAWAAEQERQRIAAEQAQRQQVSTPTSRSYAPPADGASWVLPLSPGSYSISSCFCARWGTFHDGDDLAAPLGTPILAIGAGSVVAAGPASGFGNWVVIDHGNGAFSVYGHMRTLTVSVGQTVSPGQLIAYVGNEGQSTGAHLHLGIRLGGINGTAVDPQVWLAQRGVYL